MQTLLSPCLLQQAQANYIKRVYEGTDVLGRTRMETKLENARKEAGLTKYMLAKKAGVTEPAIRKWEKNGTRKAYAGHLAKVARVLGCSVDELID